LGPDVFRTARARGIPFAPFASRRALTFKGPSGWQKEVQSFPHDDFELREETNS
jgi:hypothetical protein